MIGLIDPGDLARGRIGRRRRILLADFAGHFDAISLGLGCPILLPLGLGVGGSHPRDRVAPGLAQRVVQRSRGRSELVHRAAEFRLDGVDASLFGSLSFGQLDDLGLFGVLAGLEVALQLRHVAAEALHAVVAGVDGLAQFGDHLAVAHNRRLLLLIAFAGLDGRADELLIGRELLAKLGDVHLGMSEELPRFIELVLDRLLLFGGLLHAGLGGDDRVGLLECLLVVEIGRHAQHDREHDEDNQQDLQSLTLTGHKTFLLFSFLAWRWFRNTGAGEPLEFRL